MNSSLHYSPPPLLFNGHLETIFPALARRVAIAPYQRERITTPDDDFLDLDWLKQGSDKLVVLSHGLEGNTTRAYVKGMARAVFGKGYDVVAWNYRGCSGEMNRQLRFYHSGATDDLDTVLQHINQKTAYREIVLIGFSLGGNMTLKYLGEERLRPNNIIKAIVFSVPLDLHASCIQISKRENWLYAKRFLKSLKKKVADKAAHRKELDTRGLSRIKTLMDFDNYFTGPLHGFQDAIDYYTRCSAIRFISNITVPALVVNALNDPFLSRECFPTDMLQNHPYVKLETPENGGHVGFTQFNGNGLYWSEVRTLAFLENHD
ncbi:MAG: alpha/beta fold hydrolase [Cyclobacteriaceae bacterium]|jgi:hypothetical protein|nr:alpha/beta fold hydrolase [Cyclobacteriaceae bacterium]